MSKTHVIDGKTYVGVERKAKVGEKVIDTSDGEVCEVYGIAESSSDGYRMGVEITPNGIWISDSEYLVLVPVSTEDWPPLTEPALELTANDIRWQPDKVIDLLANLARRVSSLEQQLADTQGNVVRHGEELEAVRYGNDELYLRLKGVEERTANHRQELNVIDHEKEMIFADIVSLSDRIKKLNGGAAE